MFNEAVLFLIKAVEQVLRRRGLALCVGLGECDVLLLWRVEMDGAVVNLNKESKGTCMSMEIEQMNGNALLWCNIIVFS